MILSVPGPVSAAQGKIVASEITLPASFQVSMEITPTTIVDAWAEILRLTTTAADCCEFGDRLLLLQLAPGSLALFMAVTQPSGIPGFGGSGGPQRYIAATLELGQPAIVRCVVSPTQIELYIDGQLVASDVHPSDGRHQVSGVKLHCGPIFQGVNVAPDVILHNIHIEDLSGCETERSHCRGFFQRDALSHIHTMQTP